MKGNSSVVTRVRKVSGTQKHNFPSVKRPRLARLPGVMGAVGLAAGLLMCQSVAAITVIPLGKGQLPSGDFIVMSQLILNPGESVGWHYHPGTGLRVVLSGTLTEDAGCGAPLVAHTAGSAFQEDPGHVHRIFNLGNEPVMVQRTDILPACYVNQGTIFVDGPDCEGNSGKSHLEPIEPCLANASKTAVPSRGGLRADNRAKARAANILASITAIPHPGSQMLALAYRSRPG